MNGFPLVGGRWNLDRPGRAALSHFSATGGGKTPLEPKRNFGGLSPEANRRAEKHVASRPKETGWPIWRAIGQRAGELDRVSASPTIFGLWQGHIGGNIDTRQAFGGSASFARLGYAQQADKHSFADEEHPRDRDCRLQVGRSLRPARSSEALYLHPRPKKINPPRRLTDRRGHRDPHPKRPTEVPDHGKRKQSSKLGCPRKDCRSDS